MFRAVVFFACLILCPPARATSPLHDCQAKLALIDLEVSFEKKFNVVYLSQLIPSESFPTRIENCVRLAETKFKKLLDVSAKQRLIEKLKSPDFYPEDLTSEERKLIYGSDIEGSYVGPVVIQMINEKVGYGVFAERKIEKSEMVGEYTGVMRMPYEVDGTNNYLLTVKAFNFRYFIDARDGGNATRFINHSSNRSNVDYLYVITGGKIHVIFVASRPIEAGQQVLFNYGARYWRNSPPPEEL